MIICLSAHTTGIFDPANVARASLGFVFCGAPSSASCFSDYLLPSTRMSFLICPTQRTLVHFRHVLKWKWKCFLCVAGRTMPTVNNGWVGTILVICTSMQTFVICKESVAVFFTDAEGLREDELCAAVNDSLWHITSCQSWLWLIKILSDHQFDAHPTVLIMTVYSLLNFYPTWISFTIYEQAEHTRPSKPTKHKVKHNRKTYRSIAFTTVLCILN